MSASAPEVRPDAAEPAARQALRWGVRLLAVVGIVALVSWGMDLGVTLGLVDPMWEVVAEHSDTPPQFLAAIYEIRRQRAAAAARGDASVVAAKEAALDRAAERGRRKAAQAIQAGDPLGARTWAAAAGLAADRSAEGAPMPPR